jgi:hypothetical protein
MDEVLVGLEFHHLESDHCVYKYQDGPVVIYIAVYGDDILLASNSLTGLIQTTNLINLRNERSWGGSLHPWFANHS